jgi:cell division topological specificity factor
MVVGSLFEWSDDTEAHMGMWQALMGRKTSREVAKQRLEQVLAHDRVDIPPGMLKLLSEEMLNVMANHLDVDVENASVFLKREGHGSRLIAEVPIRGRKRQ